MLSWISDHPGWDTQELWWKMCATTHRTQRYESPWLPGIGIKGARYQTFKSKMITCLWPLKDRVSDLVIHRGDIITRNSLQSITSDVICQSQWKQTPGNLMPPRCFRNDFSYQRFSIRGEQLNIHHMMNTFVHSC